MKRNTREIRGQSRHVRGRYPGTRGRGVLFRLEVGRGGWDCYTYDRRKSSKQPAAGGLLHLCYTYETPFEGKAKATESRKRNGLERKKAAFPRKNGLFCCLQSGTSRGIRTHDPLIKSQLLYQLSYTRKKMERAKGFEPSTSTLAR